MKFLLKRRAKEDRQQQPNTPATVPISNQPNISSPHTSTLEQSRPSSTLPNMTKSPRAASRSPVCGSHSPPLPSVHHPSTSGDIDGTAILPTSTTFPTAATAARPVSPPRLSGRLVTNETDKSPDEGIENDEDGFNPFAEIPSFKDVAASEHPELFKQKLAACSKVYDFNRNTQMKAKESKRLALLELVEHVNSTRNCFPESAMQAVTHMVSANIFRALPPTAVIGTGSNFGYEQDEEDPILESSWPHLQITYEFFLRFVVSNEVDPKAVKRFIDQQFVLKLLDLFASEDPRERDYLKTVLHRIYGKIMALRSFIRKAIQNTFYSFIYEVECHRGVAELLEILGSIINGFALPLKDEHKQFLERSLIPLHKARSLACFSQQLTYCMTQYVEKDSRLAEVIIKGLLRFWPVTNTGKECLFLVEIEEIIDLTQPAEFQRIMIPLFERFAQCIQSPHFQVAERVLFLWNNDYICNLFSSNKEEFKRALESVSHNNVINHFRTVNSLTFNVTKILAEGDPQLFDECSEHNLMSDQRNQDEYSRNNTWAELEKYYERSQQHDNKNNINDNNNNNNIDL